jgi:hypothetical protein
VKLDQTTEIRLGGADDLDLVNEDVLERVDTLGELLNLGTDDLSRELGNELGDVGRADLLLDGLNHALAELLDVTGLGVRGLTELVGAALGEANDEDTDDIAIGGLK